MTVVFRQAAAHDGPQSLSNRMELTVVEMAPPW